MKSRVKTLLFTYSTILIIEVLLRRRDLYNNNNNNMASSRDLVSTIGAQASPTMVGRNQVSGRVSVPCLHTPLQMLHGNHSKSVKVKFGIKVMKLAESLIGWEVTVGKGSECHLTFVKLLNKIPVSTIFIDMKVTDLNI